MKQRQVRIVNRLGLHARPSAALTQLASRFRAEVWLTKGTRRVNAKSIMGVMMLAASRGTALLLETDGPDEDQAIDAITEMIGSGFGEGATAGDGAEGG